MEGYTYLHMLPYCQGKFSSVSHLRLLLFSFPFDTEYQIHIENCSQNKNHPHWLPELVNRLWMSSNILLMKVRSRWYSLSTTSDMFYQRISKKKYPDAHRMWKLTICLCYCTYTHLEDTTGSLFPNTGACYHVQYQYDTIYAFGCIGDGPSKKYQTLQKLCFQQLRNQSSDAKLLQSFIRQNFITKKLCLPESSDSYQVCILSTSLLTLKQGQTTTEYVSYSQND